MKSNPVKSGLGFILIGILCAWCTQSCKTPSLASTDVRYRPLVINNYKHDTLKVVEQKMTPEQYRTIQKEFYEANYKNLFAPEFKRLNGVIENQAVSIQSLTVLIESMRNRNIHRSDSMQNELNKERKESLSIQRIINDRYKTTVVQNAKEISSITHLTVWIEVCICVIFSIIIVFGIVLYWLWNQIKKLKKKINYV